MKKKTACFTKLLIIIMISIVALTACQIVCQHRDKDDDSLCDKCGEEYTDGKDVEENPTCEHINENGDTFCDKCGEEYTGDVTHTHAYTEKNTDPVYLKSEATYDSAAIYYYSCSCGDIGEETFYHGEKLDQGFVYEESPDEMSYHVTGFTGTDTILNVPSTHNGKNVIAIEYEAFKDRTDIEAITLPDTIISIGPFAFAGCTSLQSIILPKSLTYIGHAAFTGCTELAEVTVQSELQRVGFDAFAETKIFNSSEDIFYLGGWLIKCKDTGLTDIEIKEGTLGIADYAFSNCDALTSVSLNGIKYIGSGAFSYCDQLFEVICDDSLLLIESMAFTDCARLIHIVLGNNLTRMGDGTFAGCSRLHNIDLPDSITSIGSGCFKNTGFTISKSGYIYVDAWLVEVIPDYGWAPCPLYSGTIGIADYVFADYVFANDPFAIAYDMSAVFPLPDTIKYIGNGAFQDCTISDLIIPESVEIIGAGAFGYEYLPALHQWVKIPSSVKVIGVNAFGGYALTVYAITGDAVPSGWDAKWNGNSNNIILNCDDIYIDGDFCVAQTANGEIVLACYYMDTDKKEVVIPMSSNGKKITKISKYAFECISNSTKLCFLGSADDWKNIEVELSDLKAKIYFYSEDEPAEEGYFWHYVSDEISIWQEKIPSHDCEVTLTVKDDISNIENGSVIKIPYRSDFTLPIPQTSNTTDEHVFYGWYCELDRISDENGKLLAGTPCLCGQTLYPYFSPKILVIESISGESDALVNIIKNDFDVTKINIKDAGLLPDTLEELCYYDEIILCNISNDDLPYGFDELLYSFVKNMGGNVLTVAGNEEAADPTDDKWEANAFTREDMYGTLYQELLPVEIINYTPPTAVVIVVDVSESMYSEGSGTEFEKSKLYVALNGIQAALDAMTESDYIGIVVMSDAGQMVLPMTPRTQREKILGAIENIKELAGGGTLFSPAIEIAGDMLCNLANVQNKHIILVTDGEPSDNEDAYSALIKQNAKNGISMSIAGIGCTPSARELLKHLLIDYAMMDESHYHDVQDIQMLPTIMREILETPEIKDTVFGKFQPTAKSDDYPIFNDVIAENIPVLDGFYGSKLKRGAELILAGEYDVPIYAQWRYGEGFVGSFMCDLNGTWSSDFINSDIGNLIIICIVKYLCMHSILP